MAGGEIRLVFLWMETTGFDPPVRPLQISAIGKYMTESIIIIFFTFNERKVSSIFRISSWPDIWQIT